MVSSVRRKTNLKMLKMKSHWRKVKHTLAHTQSVGNILFLFLIDRFRMGFYRFSLFMWNRRACTNFLLPLEMAGHFVRWICAGAERGGLQAKACYYVAVEWFFYWEYVQRLPWIYTYQNFIQFRFDRCYSECEWIPVDFICDCDENRSTCRAQ